MAEPTIVINNSTGSDTAASGAGPASAITGTAAAHTSNAPSTTITFTNAPDLSGVSTTGSHAIWLATGAGVRKWSKITGVDNGAKTIVVADSFTIDNAAPVNYAIGGKRSSLDGAAQLFTDVKPGWVVEVEYGAGASYDLTGEILCGRSGGSAVDAAWTFRGAAGVNRPLIKQTANLPCIRFSQVQACKISHLQFRNSNATKTSAQGIKLDANVGLRVSDCVLGDGTDTLQRAIYTTVGGLAYSIGVDACEIKDTTLGGIDITLGLALEGCYIHGCGAAAVLFGATTSGQACIIIGNIITGIVSGGGVNVQTPVNTAGIIAYNTIHGNGGSGIYLNARNFSRMQVFGNLLTSNSRYGIEYPTTFEAMNHVRRNVYDSNTLGAESAAYDQDPVTIAPGYTNAAGGDFTPGAGLAGAGWPQGHLGAAATSYLDPGAVQRIEGAGAGGILVHPGMAGGMRG